MNVLPGFSGLLLNEDEDRVDHPGCSVCTDLSSTSGFVDD